MIYLFWIVLGLLLGSFAGVVSGRFASGGLRAGLTGRSRCNHCKLTLTPIDLIPVLSYLMLRGRCRNCKKKIGASHIIFEIVSAVAVLGIGLHFGVHPITGIHIIIITGLLIVAGIDWYTQEISELCIVIIGLFVLFSTFATRDINSHVIGLLIGGGIPAFLVIISKGRWMGAGDIELGALLGLWVGAPAIWAGLWLAFVVGAFYGVWLMVQKKATMRSAVAFGPFLIVGAYISLLYADTMIQLLLGGR